MGFTHAYVTPPEEAEGIRLVHLAFERGCTLFDTAEMYSYFKNEEFVGKALKELPRDKVVISDKFWPKKLPGHDFVVPIPGMRKEERVIENLGAADIELSDAEYAAINDALGGIAIYGDRDGKDIKKLGTVPENVDK